MGSRHLTMVQLDGEIKVAQYGQWDGPPRGAGSDIADFIKRMDKDAFKKSLKKVRFIDPQEKREIESQYKEINIFFKKYPQFNRDTGPKILELIYKRQVNFLLNSIDFARHSLLCEWGYVINLDTEELEIYKGFNKKMIEKTERFAKNQVKIKEYWPIKLWKRVPFELVDKIKKWRTE